MNRDTNTPVSAQLELMPSGDFIARSNLVERLYRRVNPDDWDDDGIPNDDDIQPLAYDGDNFDPHQELPERGELQCILLGRRRRARCQRDSDFYR